ncbi:11942_t:CDS:1, partial [Funneliformis geosporum]
MKRKPRKPNAFRNEMMQYNKDNLPMTEFSKLVSQRWRDMQILTLILQWR